jgi:hypothetical protein
LGDTRYRTSDGREPPAEQAAHGGCESRQCGKNGGKAHRIAQAVIDNAVIFVEFAFAHVVNVT